MLWTERLVRLTEMVACLLVAPAENHMLPLVYSAKIVLLPVANGLRRPLFWDILHRVWRGGVVVRMSDVQQIVPAAPLHVQP